MNGRKKNMNKDCLLINPAFIDSELWGTLNRYLSVYMLLRAYAVIDNTNDPLDLYNKYYKKGKLVASMTLEELSNRMGKGKKTITAYLKKLENLKFITVDKVKNRNVYIFMPVVCSNGLPAFTDGRELTDQEFEELTV